MFNGLRLSLALAFAGLPFVMAAEPLATVGEVRRLAPETAERRPPVRVEAVVTCYHKDWGVLFVHDGKDGICVGIAEQDRPAQPYAPGMRLSIEGVAGPGEFLPVILPSRIDVSGSGALPEFEKVTAERLFLPGLDCHPVEVAAVVKGTWFGDQSLVVELQIQGWSVKAVLPQHQPQSQLPWQLVERRVRVRGIAGTHFNDQRQMSGRLLFVQGLESFVLDEAAESVAEAPLMPVDGLLRVDSPLRQRVRVRGVVTHGVAGRGLYLRGEGGGLFVQTAQPVSIQTGDEVEAEGYAAVTAFRPSLSAINVTKTGTAAALPEPVIFHAANTRHSREQCELVTLEANYLETMHGREGISLMCSADGQVFEALLAATDPLAEALLPGMKLRLTGICEFSSTRPLVIPRNATGFRIQLRSPADVVVLARPPWWDGRRALWALGILAVVALVIGAWAVVLQMLVRKQSSVIRQQAQQQATLEERQRIARDLHDTLEQELVGVTMLLDSTAMKLNGSHPQASEPLGLARRLLRRVREESRSTIREMRSVTLEQRGLHAALDELLRPLATVSGAAFNVEVVGQPVRLSGTLETHLLRLAQEAVANAAHHAAAQKIDLRLEYADGQVHLAVRDDGRGFEPSSAAAAAGHFGLSGMRERAEKIAGQLRIVSQPGAGTTVSVQAPVVAFQSSSPA
ncbi:sensor histidine kinase [Prosthecobacter sp.]|uniref:sensor histidine kinase n=1 Tax=Prosthecobacter sp. TaxID=1965333 RepID=UPI002AB84A37|nr:sensor histidine kinase [Prosthecobacter sp.]MDZ4402140.1 sensor histidine kinase [Prosthecobacter sp.]